jgi:hypothetical protein
MEQRARKQGGNWRRKSIIKTANKCGDVSWKKEDKILKV